MQDYEPAIELLKESTFKVRKRFRQRAFLMNFSMENVRLPRQA
jgi:hypothetical protein